MSQPSGGPPDPRQQPPYPQQPQQPGPWPPGPPPAPRKSKAPLLALVIGGVALVLVGVIVLAAVVVLPRLTGSGVALPGLPQADLSTPDKAAQAFVAAVRAGNPDAVLPVPALAERLADAEFQPARVGSAAGSMEVPYTTPRMEQGEHAFLSFYPHLGPN